MLIVKKTDPLDIEVKKEKSQAWHKIYTVSSVKGLQLIFAASLSIYLVFDLSGKVDVEPFLVDCLVKPFFLDLEEKTDLVILCFSYSNIKNITPKLNNNEIFISSEWIYWLYYSLLDAKNKTKIDISKVSNICKSFSKFGQTGKNLANAILSDSNVSQRHKRRVYKLNFGVSSSSQKTLNKFILGIDKFCTTKKIDYTQFYDQANFIKIVKKYSSLTPQTILDQYDIY